MSEANQSQLLLGEWCDELTTRAGVHLKVRPAAPEDEALLIDFFSRVAPEDLRFRFLSAGKRLGHDMVAPLVEVDHVKTENFLAFGEDGDTLLATAMVAADEAMDRAEVAIAIDAGSKHQGIGWTLLDYVARYATKRGIALLESIESRDNLEAIGLEREMGFTISPLPGDATLVRLQKSLR